MCIRDSTHFALTAPELNVRTALLVILLGVACAAVSRLFCYTLHFMEHTVPKPVSYTHLDVYKRQGSECSTNSLACR